MNLQNTLKKCLFEVNNFKSTQNHLELYVSDRQMIAWEYYAALKNEIQVLTEEKCAQLKSLKNEDLNIDDDKSLAFEQITLAYSEKDAIESQIIEHEKINTEKLNNSKINDKYVRKIKMYRSFSKNWLKNWETSLFRGDKTRLTLKNIEANSLILERKQSDLKKLLIKCQNDVLFNNFLKIETKDCKFSFQYYLTWTINCFYLYKINYVNVTNIFALSKFIALDRMWLYTVGCVDIDGDLFIACLKDSNRQYIVLFDLKNFKIIKEKMFFDTTRRFEGLKILGNKICYVEKSFNRKIHRVKLMDFRFKELKKIIYKNLHVNINKLFLVTHDFKREKNMLYFNFFRLHDFKHIKSFRLQTESDILPYHVPIDIYGFNPLLIKSLLIDDFLILSTPYFTLFFDPNGNLLNSVDHRDDYDKTSFCKNNFIVYNFKLGIYKYFNNKGKLIKTINFIDKEKLMKGIDIDGTFLHENCMFAESYKQSHRDILIYFPAVDF
jgi:hypothetical protein